MAWSARGTAYGARRSAARGFGEPFALYGAQIADGDPAVAFDAAATRCSPSAACWSPTTASSPRRCARRDRARARSASAARAARRTTRRSRRRPRARCPSCRRWRGGGARGRPVASPSRVQLARSIGGRLLVAENDTLPGAAQASYAELPDGTVVAATTTLGVPVHRDAPARRRPVRPAARQLAHPLLLGRRRRDRPRRHGRGRMARQRRRHQPHLRRGPPARRDGVRRARADVRGARLRAGPARRRHERRRRARRLPRARATAASVRRRPAARSRPRASGAHRDPRRTDRSRVRHRRRRPRRRHARLDAPRVRLTRAARPSPAPRGPTASSARSGRLTVRRRARPRLDLATGIRGEALAAWQSGSPPARRLPPAS